jgi:S-adenosylmethionine:tRNA ribosyltransferase-isomerase
MTRTYTVADFDYTLPAELIAQQPAAERSASRLLDGRGAWLADRVFRDLPQLLAPGDLIVFNDTRVLKARLHGEKDTGGQVEALVERVLAGHEVLAHLRASKSPKPGAWISFAGGAFGAEVLGRGGPDGSLFHLRLSGEPLALLVAHGVVPLPPNITPSDAARDAERYQTVFAARPGAVAAPTASLHFDDELLARLDARGIRRTQVTLHVGAGTFQPVRVDDLAAHRMHSEWFEVSAPAPPAGASSPPARPRCARSNRRHSAARCAPARAKPTCSSRPAFTFASSICSSPTSTCRAARC